MMQNLVKMARIIFIVVGIWACEKSSSEKSCEKIVNQVEITGVSLGDTIRLTKECKEKLVDILASENDTVKIIRAGIILIENGNKVQDSVLVQRLISFIPRGEYGYKSINNYYLEDKDVAVYKIAFIGFLGRIWDLGCKKSFEVLMSYVGYGDGSIGEEYKKVFSKILKDDCKYVLEQLANYSDEDIFNLATETNLDRNKEIIKMTGEKYPYLKPISDKYLKKIVETYEFESWE